MSVLTVSYISYLPFQFTFLCSIFFFCFFILAGGCFLRSTSFSSYFSENMSAHQSVCENVLFCLDSYKITRLAIKHMLHMLTLIFFQQFCK